MVNAHLRIGHPKAAVVFEARLRELNEHVHEPSINVEAWMALAELAQRTKRPRMAADCANTALDLINQGHLERYRARVNQALAEYSRRRE